MSKTITESNAAFWDWLKNKTSPAPEQFEYLYAELPQVIPPNDEATDTVTTEVNFEIDSTIDLGDSPTKTLPGKEVVFKF